MRPDFLIIGAQKSASTFVHTCVREHPEAFMPRYETPFFEDPYYAQSDIEQFKALFEAARSEKVVGIKRPDYLAKPECPERICKHIPNAKLVVILRNPVDRAVSAYYWFMQTGAIPIRPLEEGLHDIINGLYENRYPRSRQIIDYGFYHQHLMRYLNYFDRDQLLIMLQRDFKLDAQQAISLVYRFLRIDDGYIPKALGKRPKQSVYSFVRLKWLSVAIRNFFYMYHFYDNGIAAYPRSGNMYKLIYYAFLAVDRYLLALLFDNTKPLLSCHLRDTLFNLYKQDIYSLESLLERDLMEWK